MGEGRLCWSFTSFKADVAQHRSEQTASYKRVDGDKASTWPIPAIPLQVWGQGLREARGLPSSSQRLTQALQLS